MICPYCGKEHSNEAVFCPSTGKSLSANEACPHCGQVHPSGAQFCPTTGKTLGLAQGVVALPPQKRSRRSFAIVFLVFVLFLSLLGATAWIFLGQYVHVQIPVAMPLSAASSVTSTAELTITAISTERGQENNETASPGITPTIHLSLTVTVPVISSATLTPSPAKSDEPGGKIVYTCQIFKNNDRNQICIMNADGTNQRRLTKNDRANHFYPSLAPDGLSIVFSSSQTGRHEIFEMDLNGVQTQLTSMGNLFAPEISPDGLSIIFTKTGTGFSSIFIMDRNGNNPREVYRGDGVDIQDPTWSPDGDKVLFAMGAGENKHLYTLNADGTELKIVNKDFTTRGRSDWSWNGKLIAGYSGSSWQRKIFLMNSDGSNLFALYSVGNVQAPSFSPDDNWVTFTGYIDNMGDNNGCEIYILRTNGTDLHRLTENDYCDWQPRWGR